ncbi:MAG: hypothetical protein BA863_11175 [Desulfovibrio sp. S3730MH75]|nr:MAG: hypothetical protein BA863_11175 [Desulfovibrio sp. S3730MH75]
MNPEIRVELPPESNSKPIDAEKLSSILIDCIQKTITKLSSITTPSNAKRIYRVQGTGYGAFWMQVPDYRAKIVLDKIEKLWPETATNLVDYLWNCGKPRKTLIGPKPDKMSWGRFVFGELVHGPILDMLKDSIIDQLVDSDSVKLWMVTDEQVKASVSESVQRLSKGITTVIAYCPIRGVKLKDIGAVQLTNNVALRNYTRRERCVLQSKYSSEFLWDDFISPTFAEVMAEFKYTFRKETLSREEYIGSVIDDLDLIKLAIFTLKDEKIPIAEGTCVFERGYRFDRTAPYQYEPDHEDVFYDWGRLQKGPSMWPNIEISQNESDSLIDIIGLLQQQREKKPDIKQAICHFGRACLAPLSRDVLLESVIGLEGLLVPGGGNSGYRFALHGAAILSNKDEPDENLFKRLQKLYGGRSGLAHGDTPSSRLDHNAQDARKYLAKVILRLSQLSQQGILPSEESVAKSVERMVLEAACKSIGHNL